MHIEEKHGMPCPVLPQNTFPLPLAELCHNAAVVAISGRWLSPGPAPFGHQVAMELEIQTLERNTKGLRQQHRGSCQQHQGVQLKLVIH